MRDIFGFVSAREKNEKCFAEEISWPIFSTKEGTNGNKFSFFPNAKKKTKNILLKESVERFLPTNYCREQMKEIFVFFLKAEI